MTTLPLHMADPSTTELLSTGDKLTVAGILFAVTVLIAMAWHKQWFVRGADYREVKAENAALRKEIHDLLKTSRFQASAVQALSDTVKTQSGERT